MNFADSKASARAIFKELEVEFGNDCERPLSCMRKDLGSFVSPYPYLNLGDIKGYLICVQRV